MTTPHATADNPPPPELPEAPGSEKWPQPGNGYDFHTSKVGDRWGAYWLHSDGWFKLYPTNSTAKDKPDECGT